MTAPANPLPSPLTTPAHPGSSRRFPTGSRRATDLGDRLFQNLCRLFGVVVILVFLLLVGDLVWEGWPAIRTHGFHFLIGQEWDPYNHHFGALPFVYGTLATSAIAMALAVPFGVGTAAFLSEIAPAWLRRAGSFLVEMLAAIPSVVYGLWGIFVMAPVVSRLFLRLGGPATTGAGILTAGLILAIMILPYVTAVSFDVCRAVPRSQREGSLALGATRWQTIWRVILPYARSGIIGACILALGRALGETMAVTMLIGGKEKIQLSLFAQGDSIASRLATELGQSTPGLWRSTLIELALVLVLVTVIVNSLARVLIYRVGRVKPRQLLGWRRFRAPVPLPDQTPPPAVVAGAPPVQLQSSAATWIDHLMTGVLGLSLVFTLGPLFLILGYLVYEGLAWLNWGYLIHLPKPSDDPTGGFGNAMIGSTLLVGLATLAAVPVGVLAAVYLAEYRSRRLGPAVRFVGELINGVPSIVIGAVVYALVVITTHHQSCIAGSAALSIIMIPIVMRATEESLKLVPGSLRSASLALGASRWQTVVRVILPAALPAIITGVFLAIARIAGETAPLLLTAGDNEFWPKSPHEPTASLPMFIYSHYQPGFPEWNRQAWVAALVLLGVVMALSAGIRLLTGKRLVRASNAD